MNEQVTNNTDSQDSSAKKTPEGAFSETLRLNTTDYTAVRQVLLDLLTEYKELDFPANPELLKLHVDAAVDKLVALMESQAKRELERVLQTRGLYGCDSYCSIDYIKGRIKELEKGTKDA